MKQHKHQQKKMKKLLITCLIIAYAARATDGKDVTKSFLRRIRSDFMNEF